MLRFHGPAPEVKMMTSASWMAAAAHRRREGGAELEDRHRLNMGTEALHRAGGGTGELGRLGPFDERTSEFHL